MKIKPMKKEYSEYYKEMRYNDNTIGISANVKGSTENTIKKDYSAVSLMVVVCEKGILKHEIIKESFETAKQIVESYEGSNTL